MLKWGHTEEQLTIPKLIVKAHRNACLHGWWDDPRSVGESIALMHSELSDALEAARLIGTNIKDVNIINGKPEGVPVELADCVIRIFDFCGKYGIDLAESIQLKMAYNEGRPYKYGKVF